MHVQTSIAGFIKIHEIRVLSTSDAVLAETRLISWRSYPTWFATPSRESSSPLSLLLAILIALNRDAIATAAGSGMRRIVASCVLQSWIFTFKLKMKVAHRSHRKDYIHRAPGLSMHAIYGPSRDGVACGKFIDSSSFHLFSTHAIDQVSAKGKRSGLAVPHR